MVDGLAVAAELRQRWPDDFAALTELCWLHTNRSPSSDYRWSAPLIELDASGAVREIRCANALRAYPDMPSDEISRAYRAVKRLMQRLRDPQFRLTFPFGDGDLIMFDNRRILHARNAFDAGRGERHLQGCYLDRDELLSRLRVLLRSVEK